MTRQERARDIKILCDKCGCSEKLRVVHFDQFVNHEWQPHASLRFKTWWFKQDEFKASQDKEGIGIKPAIAQNVARIWQAYLEAKEIGTA